MNTITTTSTDDRREAISWLVSQLHWEDTLDALRASAAGEHPLPRVDAPEAAHATTERRAA